MPISNLQAHEQLANPHAQYMMNNILQAVGDLLTVDVAGNLAPITVFPRHGFVLAVSRNTPYRPVWAYIGELAVPLDAFVNKGDMVVGTGDHTYEVLPAPAVANMVLITDPGASCGVRWVTVDAVLCYGGLDFTEACDSGYLAML